MKKDFTKNLISKIKTENIKKRPELIFITKKIAIWGLFGLSIFLGALSLSITISYFSGVEWFLGPRLGIYNLILSYTPFFWVIFLVSSILLSYYEFRKTESGYKYSIGMIAAINITFSVILGLFFTFIGFGDFVEDSLHSNIPKYREFIVKDKDARMVEVWQNENRGLLIGKIIEMRKDNFDLIDYNKKRWKILLDEEPLIRGRVNLRNGEKIKILGEKATIDQFIANEIRPFIGNYLHQDHMMHQMQKYK